QVPREGAPTWKYLAGGKVPREMFVPGADVQNSAIGRERPRRVDLRLGAPLRQIELSQGASGSQVPQEQPALGVPAGQRLAVGSQGERFNCVLVARKRASTATAGQIPQTDVRAGMLPGKGGIGVRFNHGQRLAVGRERKAPETTASTRNAPQAP